MAGVAMQGLGTALQMRAANRAKNAEMRLWTRISNVTVTLRTKLHQLLAKSRTSSSVLKNLTLAYKMQRQSWQRSTTQNTKPMPVNVATKEGVPDIVADTQAQEFAAADAFNSQQNQALANLNSFGQYLKETINPALTSSAADTALMGNFMRGNSSVLQSELEAANDKAYSPMAQLLTGAGRTMTGYGLYSPTGPIP